MLVIEADIHEYVRMSYVDKNILGPLVHIYRMTTSDSKYYRMRMNIYTILYGLVFHGYQWIMDECYCAWVSKFTLQSGR